MKRFKHHIRESDSTCKCPGGWKTFASFDTWCICIEDEGDDSDKDDTETSICEQVIPSKQAPPSIQFPIVEGDDTVWAKVSSSGISIKVGQSRFFEVPESEHPHIWRLVEDRLHR